MVTQRGGFAARKLGEGKVIDRGKQKDPAALARPEALGRALVAWAGRKVGGLSIAWRLDWLDARSTAGDVTNGGRRKLRSAIRRSGDPVK
jgi:hypothetical protein